MTTKNNRDRRPMNTSDDPENTGRSDLTPELVRERIARRLNTPPDAKAARKGNDETYVRDLRMARGRTNRILGLLFGLVFIVVVAVSTPLPIACVLIPLVAIYFLTATRWE